MKASSHISPLRKTLFFILGLLVAAFVVSQEVITYHCSKIAQTVQNQAEEDGEQEKSDLIYEYSCNVMLPAGGTDLLKPFTPSFIQEIVREEEAPQFPEFEVPLHNTPHYKTLFRQIISPNAP